jgi:hypothetical protein
VLGGATAPTRMTLVAATMLLISAIALRCRLGIGRRVGRLGATTLVVAGRSADDKGLVLRYFGLVGEAEFLETSCETARRSWERDSLR